MTELVSTIVPSVCPPLRIKLHISTAPMLSVTFQNWSTEGHDMDGAVHLYTVPMLLPWREAIIET